MTEHQLYRLVYLVLLLAVVILLWKFPRGRRGHFDWRKLRRKKDDRRKRP